MGAFEGPLSHSCAVTASHLPVRSAIGGRHWRPSPPSKREVPPKAAEGVIEGANSFRGRWPGGAGSEGVTSLAVPSPGSAAASIGSRQSATGARSPPSRAYTFLKEGAALAREGETIRYISFQRGRVSPAGSVGVGKAPLALNASPAPPPTRYKFLSCREFRGCETRPSKLHEVQLDSCAHPPKGTLNPGSPFYFVFLGSGACLPLWGPLRASSTLPSGRSRLPPRSVLDGAHWAPGPEPAGETVPPKAAEGVFRGKERAGKSKKSPSLLRAGGRCAGMVQPRGRWGPMPGSPLMGGRVL